MEKKQNTLYVGSLAKGLRLLRAFDESHTELSLVELAARSGLVVTAPRRLLAAYAEHAPLKVLRVPLELAPLRFALVFPASRRHEPLHRWVRERVASLFGTSTP